MDINWVNGQYAEDTRLFDSLHEAYEWTDSLYQDFSHSFYRRERVGYATPDEKVIDYLTDFLPEWASFINVQVNVHKEKLRVSDNFIFRIWVTYNDEDLG
ncbi:hypothetical protein [Solibacillus sp. CAU 1738]|uniref:hypothetical protein n=1 Tax=Solibacillus sp. CAU 1738 TaxID=3140363 RepID=UPI003260F706